MAKDDMPKRIHVDRQAGVLEIGWSDMTGQMTLEKMRQFCPCALCEELRGNVAQDAGLHMISEQEMPSAQLSDLIPVGTYAVQVRWADGHDTGIYTYAYLKQLIAEGTDAV